MVMEHGLEDFSIASLFWTSPPTLEDLHSYESVEEVKERLAVATAELQAVREEVARKEQSIAALTQLGRVTALERDLVLENLHLMLARELDYAMTSSGSPPLPLSSSSSPVAVDRPTIFNPFSAPSPVADEGRSDAAALQALPLAAVVGEDMGAASVVAAEGRSPAPALQAPTIAALPGEDKGAASVVAGEVLALEAPTLAALPGEDKGASSIVADEGRSAVTALQVPTSAAVAGTEKGAASMVAAGEGSSVVLALEAPTIAALPKPSSVEQNAMAAAAAAAARIEVPRFAALIHPSSVAHGRAGTKKKENRIAAMVAQLEVRAGKRPLPQQGRLMQAMVETGPLLQNLLVTGQMPRWRNPPSAKTLTNAMMHLRDAPVPEKKHDGGGALIS